MTLLFVAPPILDAVETCPERMAFVRSCFLSASVGFLKGFDDRPTLATVQS